MDADKPCKTLLANFINVEEKLPEEMVTSYVTWIPVINLTVPGTAVAGICESLI